MDTDKIIEDSINSLHKTLYTAWLVIFILMIVTIGIHYIVYGIFKGQERFSFPYNNLKYIFFILVFLAVIICLYIRKLHFPRQMARLLKDWNKNQPKIFPYSEILEKYSINVILSIILTENPIALGFIFSLVTGNVILFYISIIVSISLLIYCIPKKSEIKTLLNIHNQRRSL